MKTAKEIKQGLYDLADQFHTAMKNKDYAKAKHTYDTALTVAVYVDLDDASKQQLFGSRQVKPEIDGLFSERDIQKAVYECGVKRKAEEKAVMDDLLRRYGNK